MKAEIINDWVKEAYAINKANGFHDPEHPHTNECRLMLIITEISEAIEADRKGRQLDKRAFEVFDFLDEQFAKSRYWQETGFAGMFANTCKDTFSDELADVVIRCCDLLGALGKEYVFQPNFPNGFYDTFADKGWMWTVILTDSTKSVEARCCALIDEVCWYCENHGIDIRKHVQWKMRYNKTRPQQHGKAY